jgi:hypothetical protein
MAQYPKPTGNTGTFNNLSFNNNQSGGLTVTEGLKYFVSFPKTQTPSTITADNFTTTGDLSIGGDSQFGGDVEFLGGVTITGGIVFKDDVEVQGTTTLDDNLLCLTTAEIDGELTVNNNIVLNPSADAPTVQPFLELTNGVVGEYCKLYLDPNPGNDITLYTGQSTNAGLTVRNPVNSYTINPATVNGVNNYAQFLNPIYCGPGVTAGSFNVQQTTLIQDPNTNPQIFSFSNSYNGSSTPQFYFQLKNTANTAFICPMQITNTEVDINENLNIRGATTSNLNIYSPSSSTLYTGIRTDTISSVFSNSNFNGTNYGTTYFQNSNGSGIHNVLQINADGVGVTYGGLSVTGGNLSVNSGNTLYIYEASNTNSTLFNQSGINTIIRNNNSGGGIYLQSSTGAGICYYNTTGMVLSTGTITVPAIGTYPQANSNTVATITYVNQAIAGGTNPNVTTLVSTPAPSSFSYIVGLNTVTFQYTNYNTAYYPTSALEICSNGNKRVSWIPQKAGVSNNYPFQIAYPKISSNGVVNTTPTSMILTYFDITPYYTQYNWTGTNYTQVYIYCVTGTTSFSQACTYYTQVIQSGSSYYLCLTLATQTDIGTFNGSTVYYIPNLSLNWW